MNVSIPKREFSREEIDDLRERLRDYKNDGALSWAEVAQRTGTAPGTISQWVSGQYDKGEYWKNQDIPGRIHRFFEHKQEAAELDATLPSIPDFQMTNTAKRVMTAFAIAQNGDMVSVASAPGVGKTAAIKQYAATKPQVWVVTAAPSTRGVPTFLISLLVALGEGEAKGTPQLLSAKVRRRVAGSGGLIIVDEAQNLSQQALEELRSIHDETEIGVALVGDENLTVNLRRYAQLYSRLGMRLALKPNPADAEIIARAWQIERPAELTLLKEIGRKGGALRAITKVMKLAVQAARASNEPLTIDGIKEAHQQLYGEGAL